MTRPAEASDSLGLSDAGGQAVDRRILVVDDDPNAREGIRGILHGEGYQIVEAADGEEAIRKIEEEPPDLVLLDYMMPKMDGVQVCQRIRDLPECAELPVVMITALDDRESRLESLEAGADEFLTKPVDREELRIRVRTLARLNRFRLLSEERTRFDSLFQMLPDALFVIDAEGVILMANPAAEELVGERRPIHGESILQYLSREDRKRWLNIIPSVADQLGGRRVESVRIETKGGDTVIGDAVLGFVLLDGEPAIQVVVRDETERERLQEQAERSERLDAVGLAAAGIVHDFNNMLQAIQVNAEIVLGGLEPGSDEADDLKEILSITSEAADLGARLLSFARSEPGEQQEVELSALVREIEPILSHVGGRGIDIQLQLAEEPVMVMADKARFQELLTGLFVNARDAVERKGTVRISTRLDESGESPLPDPRVAHLRFEDDGPGIDDSVIRHVFDPFFTTKESEGGSGLGLSIVHRIVTDHLGRIEVDPEHSSGAAFDIWLPLSG